MILTGQYDSPFVRRVAVTLHHYGLPFERRILSVFTDFEAVLAVSPLGKVPVLSLDDGETLFDSRMILDYLDGRAGDTHCLVPTGEPARRQVLRIEAVALGLAEKGYERGVEFVRKAEGKTDPAWTDRAKRQLLSGFAWLEALRPDPWLYGERMTRADVTAATALTFLREKQPELFAGDPCPALMAHRERCEALPPFTAAPYSASEAARSDWTENPMQAR